ncbi:MAG TPA: hypothetical protein VF429_09080, partial [Anaerolineae bacterium]
RVDLCCTANWQELANRVLTLAKKRKQRGRQLKLESRRDAWAFLFFGEQANRRLVESKQIRTNNILTGAENENRK